MEALNNLRQDIDALDAQLAALYRRPDGRGRAHCSREAGAGPRSASRAGSGSFAPG